MDELFLNCYIIFSILIALIDILLFKKSIQKNKTTGRYLGYACAGAAIVDISYLISILNSSYKCMSFMSSIYFVSIDIMLICLLVFAVFFTKHKFTKTARTAFGLIMLYTLRFSMIESKEGLLIFTITFAFDTPFTYSEIRMFSSS